MKFTIQETDRNTKLSFYFVGQAYYFSVTECICMVNFPTKVSGGYNL